MQTIYVLLEKNLSTQQTRVEGVYASKDLANDVMEDLMSIREEMCAYKIEEKTIVD